MRPQMITVCTLDLRCRLRRRRPPAAPGRGAGIPVVMDCGASSAPQVRTTLYFGLARPKGAVSELEWQIFLRDEVTSAVSRRADRVGGGGPVAVARWQHRSRAVEGPAPGPSRHRSGAAIGPGRHRGVPQDVRAAVRSMGKRARVCLGVS